ncbi:hypothetical protein [Pseudoalteromonas umbrosa]|uniref:hypothetical protein n=1 Tax=Pseudoalteromonas umbrosa TaxID=3048489 RepID=UPI0024C359C9|nr:hypothetical protein [Pseudoalteromonas sp. B95]MDK1290327.1 hypothetical protein [Pseudoalteromonas sp. B95]
MKMVHLILVSVIALIAFYLQIDDPQVVFHVYLPVLAFCFIFGLLQKEPNICHISIMLAVVALTEYGLFSTGLIDLGAPDDDYLIVGTKIFGTQLLINLFAIALFIFRVQISRFFSSSSKIVLTDFDGLFHWLFIVAGIMNVLALIENALRNGLGWLSLTLIYDIYTFVGSAIMALTCGLLLTMLILQAKNKQLT